MALSSSALHCGENVLHILVDDDGDDDVEHIPDMMDMIDTGDIPESLVAFVEMHARTEKVHFVPTQSHPN